MHPSTITALLLPLLLSSVLAVPTPVQTGAASQTSPPPALVSMENGVEKDGQTAVAGLIKAQWIAAHPDPHPDDGSKRSLKGRQEDPYDSDDDTAPAAVDPTEGISTQEQDIEQGDTTTAQEISDGEITDPGNCYGSCSGSCASSCSRSLKGRQPDLENSANPITAPNADMTASPEKQ